MANFRCFGLLVAYWRRSLTKGYRPYYFYFNFQLDEQLVSAGILPNIALPCRLNQNYALSFCTFFFYVGEHKKKKKYESKFGCFQPRFHCPLLQVGEDPGNEGWVLLLVLRQLLLTRFCSVVCSVFSIFLFFFITSFGDCTRSQHQEI